MNKRRFFSLVLMLVTLASSAQVQHGYVKTKGTASKRGERLNGVTVSVRGGSSVVSTGKGEFSFNVPGKNFSFSSVSKNGYVLTDRDFLGRNFVQSSEWKVIVMEKPEQRAQEVKKIKEQVRNSLEADIKKKEAEIARLEKEGKRSASEIRKLKQQLYNAIDANEKLVEEMAERFVSIDYDQMDDVNRRATELILNGELEEAKKLLDSQGDITEIINDVNKKKEEAQKAQNHAADLCYNKYNLFLLQHQNDSAAYYLEQRTLLDTTNVQWQLEAGTFFEDYLAQYDKAQSFFEAALSHALKNGERNADVATCYDKIGSIYKATSHSFEALKNYKKALEIRKELYGERHPAVADSYNNIGVIRVNVYSQEDTILISRVPSVAYEYLNKALEINKEFYGERHPAVAVSYDNIGFMFSCQGKYSKALECYKKSLEISKEVYGERHPAVATCYNNIGEVLRDQNKYSEALEYYKKSLEINKEVYGDRHPAVATCYNKIGYVLEMQENYAEALECHKKSLEIREEVFGDGNYYVHSSRISIGDVLDAQGKYSEALEYYKKGYNIDKSVAVDYYLAEKYRSLGFYLLQKEDHYYSESLECFQKALEIYNGLDDKRAASGVDNCYHNIGNVLSKQGKYSEALEYYNKALELCKNNSDKFFVAIIYNSIGEVLREQSKYSEALEYYNKALELSKGTQLADCYNKIGKMLHEQGKYAETLEYYNKALELYKEIQKEIQVKKRGYIDYEYYAATIYNEIGKVLHEQGKYSEAFEYYNKALEICPERSTKLKSTIEDNIKDLKAVMGEQ